MPIPHRAFRSWQPLRQTRRHQHWRAALVGLAAGAVALAFQESLRLAEAGRNGLLAWLHAAYPVSGWIPMVLLAGAAGAFAGWLTARFAPDAAGSGIPHIKGVLLHVKTLDWRRILPVKFAGGVVCIGAGFSLGREGPTVQMGAAVGKLLGDLLRVPDKAKPRLMACGAGAGLAAAFHAPLAGFIFTIEELQREFSSLTYLMALIAAVVADIVATSVHGSSNAFHAEGYPAATLSALPVCIGIGLAGGAAGAAFNRAVLAAGRHAPRVLPAGPAARAGLIGAVAGLSVWWLPEAAGSGHAIAEAMLHGEYAGAGALQFVAALFAVKFLLTVLCYAARVPGGIFAPMMVMGAALGLLGGMAAAKALPAIVPAPAAFTAVGMTAFFTGVVRAPLTGVVLVLEMTGDYRQLLPLLTGAMVAFLVSDRLRIRPIYDALLAADLDRDEPDVPAHREPVLVEFVVQEGSRMDGADIKSLPLPERCLLVAIARSGADLLPGGGTQLLRGDQITAVLSGANAPNAVTRLLALSKVNGD